MQRDIVWFKEAVLPLLKNYNVLYSSFKDGDFGDLERIELEGENKGATIEFWSAGWIGIHIYDYKLNNTIFNVLFEPKETVDMNRAFNEL